MSLEALWYRRASPLQSALWAIPLAPASLAYRAVVGARSAMWERGWSRPTAVAGLRVVSVGNVVVGGAGKTPVVVLLCRWAAAAGHRVAVLTRGYGRRSREPVRFSATALPPVDEVGDEPRLIARSCPQATVFVDADRVRAAQAAQAAGFTWAVMDDGFQHRRLHREVDLVVDDPTDSGHLLPWGPLREPRTALQRASLRWGPGGEVQSKTAISAFRGPQGQLEPAAWFDGKKVVALAAIARPWRFHEALEALGAQVVERITERDHAPFAASALQRALATAGAQQAVLVTTEKDSERLPPEVPAWTAQLSLELTHGQERLAECLGLPLDQLPR